MKSEVAGARMILVILCLALSLLMAVELFVSAPIASCLCADSMLVFRVSSTLSDRLRDERGTRETRGCWCTRDSVCVAFSLAVADLLGRIPPKDDAFTCLPS